MELGRRRILHHNVTAHPTAEWMLQQFREAIPGDHEYKFLIHDRDSIFSADKEVKLFGLRVLRTPVRAPKANAYCERLIGTIRRECLDRVIPLSEKHLRRILRKWVAHIEAAHMQVWDQEFQNRRSDCQVERIRGTSCRRSVE